MSKDYIQITDDKGVERMFHNFTDLVAFIDSFSMKRRVNMAKGTNEYVDEEDGRPYQKPEVDVDAINDEIWLRKKEEEEQQQKEKQK